MKQKNSIIFIALLMLVVIVSGCTSSSPTSTNNAPTNNIPTANNPSANNPTATAPAITQTTVTAKITDAKYAGKAYLISGETLDAATQTAISGFNIDKTINSDGTTTIKLSSSNPGYTNQSYTLQPGQKLYFI
jgi:hypothetical protein